MPLTARLAHADQLKILRQKLTTAWEDAKREDRDALEAWEREKATFEASAEAGADGKKPKFPTKRPEQKADRLMLSRCTVTLMMRGGGEIGGIIGEVDTHHVVIESMAGKEFFDAVVRLDEVQALVVRARDPQSGSSGWAPNPLLQ